MNEATTSDPFNNNCYGTLVDPPYKLVNLPVLDVLRFQRARSSAATRKATARRTCPPTCRWPARWSRPAPPRCATSATSLRKSPSTSPRTAPAAWTASPSAPTPPSSARCSSETELEEKLQDASPRPTATCSASSGRKTKKYYDAGKKKGCRGGMFNIIIDPSQVQGLRRVRHRLRRQRPEDDRQDRRGDDQRRARAIATSRTSARATSKYISDNLLIDMMLKEQTHIYVGGAGSCAGCGEGTALRMMCSATGSKYGDQWGIVAATGCNTVYTSTYPYNPYLVPWTNSLFENAPADAIGVRMRWDQMGWQDKPHLVHRRRRRHVRHRLPVAFAPAGQRHEHQGLRARHAGLLQHRRPGLHLRASPARTPR